MEGLREIRRRLRAVQGTAKITRAMQLVAASKVRHAQRAALDGRRHSLRLEELAEKLMALKKLPPLPLLRRREVKRRGILFVSTDRGLCGALNQSTFHLLRAIGGGGAAYVAVGRKGSHLIAARRWPLLAEFSVHDSVPFFQVKAIANFLRDSYLSGEIDTVEVAYSVYVNALRQEPLLRKLLPWDGLGEDLQKFHALLPGEANSLPQDGRKLLVEPTPELLLETLLEGFFRRELFHILLEAKAAEQGARMVAMKAATDNAEALTRELQLVYNRARQASITNEILEITAGRELR